MLDLRGDGSNLGRYEGATSPSMKRARLGDAIRNAMGNGADPTQQHSVPSESEILALVSERESHRQARRFADSDAIREELRKLGVELYDKEKEWRASDGRRGRLFTAGAVECPLGDEDILDRVRQREEARRTKDWSRADVIRDELRTFGVELDDRHSGWRTATGRSGAYNGSTQPRNRLECSEIRRLVAERERFRSSQDFEAADCMRVQLLSMGVELVDADRIWKSSDGQQGVIVSGGCEVDCALQIVEISFYVTRREEARSARDWGQADLIRDELRRQGVELLDDKKIWCTTDGRQGSYSCGNMMVQTVSSSADALASRGSGPRALAGPFASGQTASITQVSTACGVTFCDASIQALVAGRERA